MTEDALADNLRETIHDIITAEPRVRKLLARILIAFEDQEQDPNAWRAKLLLEMTIGLIRYD